MQSKKIVQFASLGIKTLSLAVALSCLMYSTSNAAGLGKLSVLSALGQPLRAEIEITSVTNDDVKNLVPKLAGYDEFERAHLEHNPILSSLRFSIEDRGARHFVLITSNHVINEPYVELLVELNSSTGRLIREYSMLLEPIEMQANRAPISNDARIAATSAQANITMPTTASVQKKLDQVKSGGSSSGNGSAGSNEQKNAAYYKIKSGDTLTEIASKFRHQGISLEQMLVAIQRSNPSVFINDNMNLIKSGEVLTIPEAGDVQHVDSTEAKKIIVAHSVDFNEYRNKLADQVVDMQPEKGSNTKKINDGKITAKVAEVVTPANESKDKLTLSKADLKKQGELLTSTLEEENIAQHAELDEANRRIKELEENNEKLQKMIALQSAAATSSPPISTNNAGAAVLSSSALPVIETIVPKPTEQPKNAAVSMLNAVQQTLNDWVRYLPYGIPLLVLLGAVGLYLRGRKKGSNNTSKKATLDIDRMRESIRPEPVADPFAHSLTAQHSEQLLSSDRSDSRQPISPEETAPQSHTDSPISDLEVHEVDQAADVANQADAYIAYGRHQQAEELLNEALLAEPDSQRLRIKLLEIYAHCKDTKNFEATVRRIYEMTGGHGSDWAQVVAMGVIFDPQNVSTQNESISTTLPTPVIANEALDKSASSVPEVEPNAELATLDFDFDLPVSTPEPLQQVETNPLVREKFLEPKGSQEHSMDIISPTPASIDIDFSGIDLELPKLPADMDQEKLKAGPQSAVSLEIN